MTDARATRLVHKWRKLVDARRRDGKTASSTAEHVARFERMRAVSPHRDEATGYRPQAKTERDPALDKKALWKGIDKDIRQKNREKVLAMREKIRSLMKGGPEARQRAKAYCQEERQKAVARAQAIRIQMKAEARALAEAERTGATWRCGAEKRLHSAELARLRQDLLSERKHQADIRRIEAENRARGRTMRPGLKRAAERKSESDDEVRSNIPEELVPLFNRVRRSIKPGLRKSRTEAFLEYVEEHPGEEYQGLEDKTDALVRELERQQRAGRR
jgi:hypothetical protein